MTRTVFSKGTHRSGLAFLGVVLFLTVLVGRAFGATFTARAPEDFVRSTGALVTITQTFNVLDPTTTFTLVIYNGGANNQYKRVSSAVITINGTTIAGPSDFNQQVSLIQKPVSLSTSNTLTVELRSAPGSGITLELIGVDNVPPTITASADRPPNLAGWYNANVLVTFTCYDKTSGVASCPVPVAVSTEGANQVITGTAMDNAGNVATAQIVINLDKTPPIATAARSPGANARGWNNASVTVSFSGMDALSGIASCSPAVTLANDGANQSASGTCTDNAGNVSQPATVTGVNIDKTPPTLTFGAATPRRMPRDGIIQM